jgi:hypothetical protein
MISRSSKQILTVGALYLIFWDLATLFTMQSTEASVIFDTVLMSFIPCKMLVGITVLLNLSEHNLTKIFTTLTAVISSAFAFIHIFALVFQIVLIAKGQGTTGTAEYFEIARFVGGILILISFLLLMIKISKERFTKTTLALSLTAITIFTVYHVADVVFAVKSMATVGAAGLGDFLTKCLTFGFVLSVLGLAAYLAVFTISTNVFEKEIKDKR